MSLSHRNFFTAFVITSLYVKGAFGYALVTGTVFCDQCRDGQVSILDYPIYGIKVTMTCPGNGGQSSMWREETTNWFGSYAIRFDGTPNLSGCYAQVSGSANQVSNGCAAAAGPAQYLRLMFDMFGMAMYAVDPLISQPTAPVSFCPGFSGPAPVIPTLPPPPARVVPPPTVPHLPPMPPVPFLEASACPYQKWMMPEFRCYWRVVAPETKVAIAFGLIAANRYGTDMSLEQGMLGRGDPYRTLLREGTTALLNSYNSIQFPYHPLDVIQRMNWALMSSSTRQILHTALAFMKANSGAATNVTCRFTPCN